MTNAGSCRRDDVERSHHAGWKPVKDGRFQVRDSSETRMMWSPRGKINACTPSFVKRVGRRVNHARKIFDILQLAHRRGGKDCLDGLPQALVIDGAGESTSQSGGSLLEGEYL